MKLVAYDQFDTPEIQKYIDSVFFVISSMTGLGFAYIYPRTNLEYFMQSMIMVVGVSTYANLFGFFAVSIYNRNKKRMENMIRLQESKDLAVLRNFPEDIRNDIRTFYNDMKIKYDNFCNKFEILKELPGTLKSELSLFINSEVIQKVNFFQFADPSFILQFSKFLKPKLCLQDNYVIYMGEIATKMYFVKSGIVQILSSDNKTVIAYMSEGAYFGEIGVLLTQKRTCYVKARTACLFFTISSNDLQSVLQQYPIQEKFLRAVASQRLKTTHTFELEEQDNSFEVAAKQKLMLKSLNSKSKSNHLFDIIKKDNMQTSNDRNEILNYVQSDNSQKCKSIYLTKDYLLVSNFVIIPFSMLFNIWNMIFVAAFIYNLLFVPFSIGLDYELQGSFIAIDIFAVLIFFADTVIRPFLAIDLNKDIEINRLRVIQVHTQNYMLLDIISTIPIDYLLMSSVETQVYCQYLRILRLLKFYRIKELIQLIRRHTSVNEQMFRIVLLFLAFFLISHLFNCILVYICLRQTSDSRFDGKTLLDFMKSLPYAKVPKPDKMTKWDVYFSLLDLCCCYMGSIVYGDIIPFTIAEETLGIFQMILGRMFISFLFAEVSSYVASQYQTYNHHIQTRNRTVKWMQLNNIDSAIQQRVNKFFDFKWKNQKGIEESSIIKDLPSQLRVNVKNYIFHNLILNSDVFPKDNLGFIKTVTKLLQRRLVTKNEFVIKQGEMGTEMYFILKGKVIVQTEDGKEVETLQKYMHFGQMALLESPTLLRRTSIRAATNVVLAVLTLKDFNLICQHYPEFQNNIKESRKMQFSKMLKMNQQRLGSSNNKGQIGDCLKIEEIQLDQNRNKNFKNKKDQLTLIIEDLEEGQQNIDFIRKSHKNEKLFQDPQNRIDTNKNLLSVQDEQAKFENLNLENQQELFMTRRESCYENQGFVNMGSTQVTFKYIVIIIKTIIGLMKSKQEIGLEISGIWICEALVEDDVRNTWLNRVPSPLPNGVRTENNLDGISNNSIYIHALYLVTNTISHVAIGDLTSISTKERALNSFVIWFFTFFYAFCFANIASIVGDFLGNNFLKFHEKFSSVMNMIPQDRMPRSILGKVNNYYNYLWAHSQGNDEQSEIINELPNQIKYDVMMNRFQEAIQNSLIFKNDQGQIDVPMLNSIFELMKIRVYMPSDIIVKCGSCGKKLYLFLDGEAIMFGINNELICIMGRGTHFNNIMGEDTSEREFEGKRLCHLVAKTLTIVGVIEYDDLQALFQAYPYWKLLIIQLNRSLQKLSRACLQNYISLIGADISYQRELKAVENHFTYSDDSIYDNLVGKLFDPKNSYIYNHESEQYQNADFLQNQLKKFQKQTGITPSYMNSQDNLIVGDNQYILSKRPSKISQNKNRKSSKMNKWCRTFIIPQESKTRKFIDFIHLINMVYMSIMIPIEIAFIDEPELTLIFEICSILMQITVIAANFKTPISVRGGYTLNFYLILKNYYQNGGLIFDLFGILPLNCILGFMNISFPGSLFVRIFRLIRILAIHKLLKVLEKFEVHFKTFNIIVYIVKTILILYLLWHWTACFWLFINKRIEPSFYKETWYTTFKLDDKQVIEQYLLSFYYVIKVVTGVGQSDMITYNDLERVCFMIMINIGDTLFAFAFGLIASIQMQISQNNEFENFLEKMKQIDEFSESINLNQSQCEKVGRFFSYSYFVKSKSNLIEAKEIKQYLPYNLAKEVIYHSQKEILIPMFRAFKSDNLIREVSSVLANLIFMPGDYIVFKDQIGEEMYFIVEGQVQIIAADKQTVLKTFHKGNYFGENAIFMKIPSNSYVQAKTFCVVSMLKNEDLDKIILNFPDIAKQFKEEAKRRIAQNKKLEFKRKNHSDSYLDSQDCYDDSELSFLQALNNKLENSQQHSFYTEHSNHSLIKQARRKSRNIDEEAIRSQTIPQIPESSHDKDKIIGQDNKLEMDHIDQNEAKGDIVIACNLNDRNILEFSDSLLSSENDEVPDLQEASSKQIARGNFKTDKIKQHKNKIEEVKLSFNDSQTQQQQFQLSQQKLRKTINNAFSSYQNKQQLESDQRKVEDDDVKELKQSQQILYNQASPNLPYLKKYQAVNKPDGRNLNDAIILFENDLEEQISNHSPEYMSPEPARERSNTEIIPIQQKYEFAMKKSRNQNKKHQKIQSSFPNKNKFAKREYIPSEIFKTNQQNDLLNHNNANNLMDINQNILTSQQNKGVDQLSIRRQPKSKKNKRRLSKISLGKNLMLSQTAGLKLQWTVGK
eukprot:403377328